MNRVVSKSSHPKASMQGCLLAKIKTDRANLRKLFFIDFDKLSQEY